jgi:hypothetical protein
MADADARWLSPESRAGPNRGAVVSGSGSGSGSSSAQRAATTAVHLLGAGAACIWILLACNEHNARLIGCRSRTAGQEGTWCIVRNDHGPESRREATSTSPSSSPDAANACLSCLPFAPPLTESSARHREDQHTHAAASSGRPVRNAASERARADELCDRGGRGTRVVQLLPTDRPSSNNFDSNPGRAVVRRMWSGRREPYAAAAAVPCVVQGQLTCARQDHCSDDKSQCITNRWIGDCKVLVSFAASIYCCAVSGKSAVSVASRNK